MVCCRHGAVSMSSCRTHDDRVLALATGNTSWWQRWDNFASFEIFTDLQVLLDTIFLGAEITYCVL